MGCKEAPIKLSFPHQEEQCSLLCERPLPPPAAAEAASIPRVASLCSDAALGVLYSALSLLFASQSRLEKPVFFFSDREQI